MNEKLAKKLKKILAKAGLQEDEIDGIVEEVEQAVAEEVTPDGGDPVETEPVEGEVPSDEVVPTEEGTEKIPAEVLPIPQEEIPAEADPLPVEEEGQVPPTDGSIEGALQELAAQEGGEVPPTEQEVPPAVPQVDPQIEQLISDLGEAHKTIEGLITRIESLEEALKSAGVITDGGSQLGDEQGAITPSANHDASADAFDDILRTINGK